MCVCARARARVRVRACVCACVCVRERERERKKEWEHPCACSCVCVCVWGGSVYVCVCVREREREREMGCSLLRLSACLRVWSMQQLSRQPTQKNNPKNQTPLLVNTEPRVGITDLPKHSTKSKDGWFAKLNTLSTCAHTSCALQRATIFDNSTRYHVRSAGLEAKKKMQISNINYSRTYNQQH